MSASRIWRLDAIRKNPQIVMEAVQIHEQERSAAQAEAEADVLENQRQLLKQDPNAPEPGNPNGDAPVVEFFEYNCPIVAKPCPKWKDLSRRTQMSGPSFASGRY